MLRSRFYPYTERKQSGRSKPSLGKLPMPSYKVEYGQVEHREQSIYLCLGLSATGLPSSKLSY